MDSDQSKKKKKTLTDHLISFHFKCILIIQTTYSTILISSNFIVYTLLKSDVTRRDHVSVVMDPMNVGSRIVNFIRDSTVFA